MVPHPDFTARPFAIPGDPTTYYDKPIAVLTGTDAVSNGDWESLRMGFRPMVRTFGKPSNGVLGSYLSKSAIQSPRMWEDWLRRKPASSATATDRPKSSAETCPLGSITRSFPPGFKALWMLLKNTA